MNNKLLSIDLSNNKISDIDINDKIIRLFLGGRGLGLKLFTDNVPIKVDPLGKENQLIFATGIFGDTSIPTNGRFSLVTKSPLTGGIFFSNSGGFFGPYMKRCGYDGIIVDGVC